MFFATIGRCRRLLFVRAALSFVAALAILGAWSAIPSARLHAESGPSFRLVDQHLRVVDEKQLGQKPTVLHFGFTHCPVICPTTMFEVAERMRELGPLADAIQFVFVTVDPERDSPEYLRQYVSSFDDRIIGLSGDANDIKSLADGLGATFSRQPLNEGGYTIDHTIFAYLMAPGWTKAGVLYMGSGARSDRVLSTLKALAALPERRMSEATKK